jgi:phage tail-like protein
MANRKDPLGGYNFHIMIDNITGGGFKECTGLGLSQEMGTYREGNDHGLGLRKIPALSTVPNITLKRGIITERSLWDWFMDIKEGKENRRQMTIVLENDQHIAQITWHLVDCFPIRWSGPTLDATSNEFGFEEVEICCEDIHLDTWETK